MWRTVITFIVFLTGWQLLIRVFQVPDYLLPSPVAVGVAFQHYAGVILANLVPTLMETLLGLFFGVLIGCMAAVSMVLVRPIRAWLLPCLLISQAIPTFALAPLLVLWLGFGMASKVVVTMIMLFFPVTSALYDGLTQVPRAWLDVAAIANATKWRTCRYILLPAAMPSLASGIRVATAIAPIGAIIGEWVGASEGLGYLMLNANARMQIDLLFACLFVIIAMSLSLYYVVNQSLVRLVK